MAAMRTGDTHGEVAFASDTAHVAVAIADVTYSGRHNLIPGLVGQWIEAELALTRFNRLDADGKADADDAEQAEFVKLQLGNRLSEFLTDTGAVDGLRVDFRTDPDAAAIHVKWNGCRGNMADGSLAIPVVLTGRAPRRRA